MTFIVLCALLVGVVSLADFYTPPAMVFGAFYFVPIALAAWLVGRLAGVGLAVVATILWSLTDHMAIPHQDDWIFVWNAATRLALFVVIVVALSRIRSLQGELRQLVDQRTGQLQAETAQRVAVERELVATSHREQQRIGHELHDGLGQYLAGISLRAKALEYSLAEQGLPQADDARQLTRLARQAVSQARNLARGLDPVELEDNDLVAALRNLAAETRRSFAIDCVFHSPDGAAALCVDKETALALYRISQEAIHNAVRHGEARNVTLALELALKPAAIKLRITDDGKGTAVAPGEEKGMGLHIMRYRADAIGATLEIRPGAPRGFEICCIVPADRRSTPAPGS